MGSRRIIAWCVAAAAGAVVLEELVPSLASSPSAAAPAEAPAGAPASLSLEGLAALPARKPMAPSQGELFAPRSWDAPSATREVQRAAPPVPYRVAGQATYADGMRVVLAREGRVFFVREGDTLEGGYRVQSIKPDAVTLVYLPLGTHTRLKVSGAPLEVDRPALARRPADARRAQAASGGTAAR